MRSGLVTFHIALKSLYFLVKWAPSLAVDVPAGLVQLRLLNRTSQSFAKSLSNLRNEIESVSYAKLPMPNPASNETEQRLPFCQALCGSGDNLRFDLKGSDPECVKFWPYVNIADNPDAKEGRQDYHNNSLPCFAEIRQSSIPNANLGVFTRAALEPGVVFGPYEGQVIRTDDVVDNTYVWDVNDEVDVDGAAFSVDGKDKRLGNWLRYINSARWGEEQNTVAILHGFEVHYTTYVPVKSGAELLVWYGPRYELPFLVDERHFDEGIAPPKAKVRCPSCTDWDGAPEPKLQTRQSRRHQELK